MLSGRHNQHKICLLILDKYKSTDNVGCGWSLIEKALASKISQWEPYAGKLYWIDEEAHLSREEGAGTMFIVLCAGEFPFIQSSRAVSKGSYSVLVPLDGTSLSLFQVSSGHGELSMRPHKRLRDRRLYIAGAGTSGPPTPYATHQGLQDMLELHLRYSSPTWWWSSVLYFPFYCLVVQKVWSTC